MYLFWKKNQTGNKYYCLGENKSIKGKSVRIKEIYLGTADKIFELLHSKKDLDKINAYEYGLTIALLQEMNKSGLYKILKEIFPDKIRGIPVSIGVLIVILNKIISPQSKRGINNWYKKSVLCKIIQINPDKLSSQFFFECIRELTEKRIKRIEYRMAKNVKKIEKLDSILCDMTHIETYIREHEGNKLPQRGKTRNKTGRRLVNLALMITRDNSIPLFHFSYPGNINDVTEFAEIVKMLEKRFSFLTGNGKKKITIMIDKGNNNEPNINGLDDEGYFFIGRLRPSSYKELLGNSLKDFKDKYEGKQDIKSYTTYQEIYGKRRKIIVKFDRESYDKSYDEFMDLIERRKNEVRQLQNNINYKLIYGNKQSKAHWVNKDNVEKAITRILNKNPTKGLFKYILKHNKKKIDVKVIVNRKQYQERLNLIGKYILFTNRKRWDHNKIIKAFLDQYLIEEQYKTLKGRRIKIAPLNHWIDSSIKADIFLSVLSLQLMNLFLMRVSKKKIDLSNNEILDTLEQIKVSYYRLKNKPEEFDMMNDMDENEKLLYEKLKLDDKKSFSYIKRAFS